VSRRSSFRALGRGAADRTTLPLEDYFGIDSQFELDKEKYVMSIICRRQVFTLAFHNQETLESCKDFISHHLGEGDYCHSSVARCSEYLGMMGVAIHRWLGAVSTGA